MLLGIGGDRWAEAAFVAELLRGNNVEQKTVSSGSSGSKGDAGRRKKGAGICAFRPTKSTFRIAPWKRWRI